MNSFKCINIRQSTLEENPFSLKKNFCKIVCQQKQSYFSLIHQHYPHFHCRDFVRKFLKILRRKSLIAVSNMDDMEDVSETIKRDTCVVFSLARLVGTFPYNVQTLRRSKLFSVWSFIVFATIFRFLSIGYGSFKSQTNNKVEFYTIVMMKLLIGSFVVVCGLLLYHAFIVKSKLMKILLELNRVQSYFAQLSCQDVAPK